jgi:hypothetical protein
MFLDRSSSNFPNQFGLFVSTPALFVSTPALFHLNAQLMTKHSPGLNGFFPWRNSP